MKNKGTQTMNLKEKLIAIRIEAGEYIPKTQKGNQGAMYADPAILLKNFRDSMDKHKVLLIPEILSYVMDKVSSPIASNADQMDFQAVLQMQFVFEDAETDEKLVVPWVGIATHMKDPSMAFGGALTYTERYFLLKFFQVPTSKDDPEAFKKKTAPDVEYISESQVADLEAMMQEKGIDVAQEQKLLSFFKVKNIEELQTKFYPKVIEMLGAIK